MTSWNRRNMKSKGKDCRLLFLKKGMAFRGRRVRTWIVMKRMERINILNKNLSRRIRIRIVVCFD